MAKTAKTLLAIEAYTDYDDNSYFIYRFRDEGHLFNGCDIWYTWGGKTLEEAEANIWDLLGEDMVDGR